MIGLAGVRDRLEALLAEVESAIAAQAPAVTPEAFSRTIVEADIAEAAQALGVGPAEIRAVTEVESRGHGFEGDRPIILFEPHVFSRLTRHRYDDTQGGVSYPVPGTKPYPKTQAERWAQMEYAAKLDEAAALQSASWGLFQIMGFNFAAAGFSSVALFVLAMKRSERDHLMAFVSFVKANKLDDELRAHDWAGFARGYNGPNFAKNAYDTKLAQAFTKWSAA